MYTTFLLLLLAVNFQSIRAENEINTENRFIVNAVIRQLFEAFRNLIKNGSVDKGIPVLDPYEFNFVPFDLTGKFTSGTANLTDGILSGLAGFQIPSFTFAKSDVSMDLNLIIPSSSFRSDFSISDGKVIGILPIYGNGTINVEVQNTLIQGKIYLKQSDDGKSILISHSENLRYSIESMKSRTHFDDNIDVVFNAMVEDLVPYYLNRFSKFICSVYGDSMVRSLNIILNKLESWHIIAVIL